MASSNSESRADRVLDTLGDPVARTALRLGYQRPVTAEEIAEAAELSRSSIYTRLHDLVDLDLMEEVPVIDGAASSSTHYRTVATDLAVQISEAEIDVWTSDSSLENCLDVLNERLTLERASYDGDEGTVTVTVSADGPTFRDLLAYVREGDVGDGSTTEATVEYER